MGVASCKCVRPTITTIEKEFGLGLQCVAQHEDGGNQFILQLLDRRDVHGGRERVVGGLAVIDVVVGVDRSLRAHLSSGELDRTVGDHLIGIHIGLRARSGLEHHQREFAFQLPVDDLLGSPDDQVDLFHWELAQLPVRQGGTLLEDSEGSDHGPAPAVALHADREVEVRALGLCSP
jgi:hypothetical protein